LRHKPNYVVKAQILKNNQSDLKAINKSMSFNYLTSEWGLFIDSKPLAETKNDYYDNGKAELFDECVRINNSNYHRRKKLKNRIEKMCLKYECTFLTLTFKDSVLNSTTAETRRRYVVRFLKQYGCYVANVDYGKEHGREHYHAIINSREVNYKEWNKYGAINGERIRVDANSNIKLAKYINKLTNHAIKETNKRSVIIYSRKTSK